MQNANEARTHVRRAHRKHSKGDAFAVVKRPFTCRLNAVSKRVTEIEKFPFSAFALIFFNDAFFQKNAMIKKKRRDTYVQPQQKGISEP